MSDYPLTDAVDFERGAICERCERPFALHEPYTMYPEGMVGDSFVGVAVCLSCAELSALERSNVE